MSVKQLVSPIFGDIKVPDVIDVVEDYLDPILYRNVIFTDEEKCTAAFVTDRQVLYDWALPTAINRRLYNDLFILIPTPKYQWEEFIKVAPEIIIRRFIDKILFYHLHLIDNELAGFTIRMNSSDQAIFTPKEQLSSTKQEIDVHHFVTFFDNMTCNEVEMEDFIRMIRIGKLTERDVKYLYEQTNVDDKYFVLNSKNPEPLTLLAYLTDPTKSKLDYQLIKLLIEYGADPNAEPNLLTNLLKVRAKAKESDLIELDRLLEFLVLNGWEPYLDRNDINLDQVKLLPHSVQKNLLIQ